MAALEALGAPFNGHQVAGTRGGKSAGDPCRPNPRQHTTNAMALKGPLEDSVGRRVPLVERAPSEEFKL